MLGVFARAAAWLAARSTASASVLTRSGRWVLSALGFATVFDAAVDVATTPGATIVAGAPPAAQVRAEARATVQTIGFIVLVIAAGAVYWLFFRRKK